MRRSFHEQVSISLLRKRPARPGNLGTLSYPVQSANPLTTMTKPTQTQSHKLTFSISTSCSCEHLLNPQKWPLTGPSLSLMMCRFVIGSIRRRSCSGSCWYWRSHYQYDLDWRIGHCHNHNDAGYFSKKMHDGIQTRKEWKTNADENVDADGRCPHAAIHRTCNAKIQCAVLRFLNFLYIFNLFSSQLFHFWSLQYLLVLIF